MMLEDIMSVRIFNGVFSSDDLSCFQIVDTQFHLNQLMTPRVRLHETQRNLVHSNLSWRMVRRHIQQRPAMIGTLSLKI